MNAFAIRAAATLALFATCGCSNVVTELVIVIDTDFEVPRALDRVEVSVAGPSGSAVLSGASVVSATSLPLSLGAVPEEGAPLGPVTITVTGRSQGRAVVDRVIRTNFVSGERRVVPVVLLRACAGVACLAGQSCGPQGCASVDAPGAHWPLFSGTVSRLDASSAFAGAGSDVSSDMALSGEAPAIDAGLDGPAPDFEDVPASDGEPRDVDVLFDGSSADTAPDALAGFDAVALLDVPPEATVDAPIDALLDAPADSPSDGAVDRASDGDAATSEDGPVDAALADTRADTPFVDAPIDAGCSAMQPCPGALTCCDRVCVDTSSSPEQCGGCGRRCALTHATPDCVEGTCAVATCEAGFGDCDRVPSNGCETRLNTLAHCGSCGAICPPRPHATPVCRASGCGVTCDPGFGDCNGDPADGCEVDLQADEDHCGACGFACETRPFAPGMCSVGTCRTWCAPGRGDCDGNPANGCETDLRTSSAHCGRCGNVCSGGACGTGLCGNEADVGAGGVNACARRQGGDAVCWGANYNGQIGNGRTGTSQATPAGVVGVTDAVEVGCGLRFCCARRASGRVSCWGENTFRQLGNGGTESAQTTPVDVTGLTDAASIALGDSFVCARRAGGAVVCWGDNGGGQLGDGTTTSRSMAMAVAGLPTGVVEVAAGSSHVCVRTGGGHVWCWGENRNGQLGDGSTTSRGAPSRVDALSDAISISAGRQHTCALRVTGSISCWGGNSQGELGEGTRTLRATPVAVMGVTDAVAITAHTGGFSCAVRAGGTVVCWGYNNSQLGLGYSGANVLVPGESVVGLTDAVAITSGLGFSCVRRRTGALACWGSGPSGELGNGTTADRNVPVAVVGVP